MIIGLEPGRRQDLGWADSEQGRGGRRRVHVQLERRHDPLVEIFHRHRRNVAKFLFFFNSSLVKFLKKSSKTNWHNDFSSKEGRQQSLSVLTASRPDPINKIPV